MESEKQNVRRSLGHYLRDKFDLHSDQEQQAEVVANIYRGVEFKGTNLWVLIFATMIASLGLNVNSAAVIIGAMLISPLMGPIMGLGLSLGINDFDEFKRAGRNFLLMICVSIVTSTLYFAVSPLSDAQSELFARATPTIYDVLIAFFGGLAGIVAQSRKDRSTSMVIPGVAIATALMPPLCTAGYGIATGQLRYFLGAGYLFFINTVFIAFATFAVVRFLGYDKKVFLDKAREKRVRTYLVVIMIVTVVPSVVIAWRLVQRSVFESNARHYVESVFTFPDTEVIDREYTWHKDGGASSVELLLIGEPVSDETVQYARARMPEYGLAGADLVVRQVTGGAGERIDLSSLQLNYAELLTEKNRRIGELQARLAALPQADTLVMQAIAREAGTVVDGIGRISVSRAVDYDPEGQPKDTVLICRVVREGRQPVDTKKLAEWLAVRTGQKSVKVFVD